CGTLIAVYAILTHSTQKTVSEMNKMMKTMMAAALGLTISEMGVSAGEYNCRIRGATVTFTSDMDGGNYWRDTRLEAEAVRCWKIIADYAIRHNLREGVVEDYIAHRAYEQAAAIGYPALVKFYGDLVVESAKKELNRWGFYYPAT